MTRDITEGLYAGLISGTSADGVDTALVEIDAGERIGVAHTASFTYPDELKSALHDLVYSPPANELQLAMETDEALGHFFADCIAQLIDQAGRNAEDIVAIGSHGQTLRHYPDGAHPATLQAGDPNIIAAKTGVQVVADFRRADMAAGGQGAPLMPAFHAALLAGDDRNLAVVNAGGIANVSVIENGRLTRGLDTGPANTLMDQWIREHRDMAYDEDGSWAAGGEVNEALLDRLLDEPWFARPAPKSTGQELFNLGWARRMAADLDDLDPRDVQATLLALSCRTISEAIRLYLPSVDEVIVCGGGAYNGAFMTALAADTGCPVTTTADYGIDPDWIEAVGFAWLAARRIAERPGNAPAVTGASRGMILGAVWPASPA